MNISDKLIINRKRLIKEINVLRDERKQIQTRINAGDSSLKVDLRVINARLSEKWSAYNDVVKTSKLIEPSGK